MKKKYLILLIGILLLLLALFYMMYSSKMQKGVQPLSKSNTKVYEENINPKKLKLVIGYEIFTPISNDGASILTLKFFDTASIERDIPFYKIGAVISALQMDSVMYNFETENLIILKTLFPSPPSSNITL